VANLSFWQLNAGETDHPIELAITLREKLSLLVFQLIVQLFTDRHCAIAYAIGINERDFLRGNLRRF